LLVVSDRKKHSTSCPHVSLPPHSFRALDVTSAADVRDWADSVIAQQGAPDLVVCNASIVNDASKRAWELSDEEFDQVGLDGQHSGESATVPLPGYVL
jgi:NAD(P)-dependent dehydrogenase (short-subunit alcohol dehydrogenase family)